MFFFDVSMLRCVDSNGIEASIGACRSLLRVCCTNSNGVAAGIGASLLHAAAYKQGCSQLVGRHLCVTAETRHFRIARLARGL